MTTNAQGGSARIYQFPLRGRFAGQQTEAKAGNHTLPREAAVAVDSAWYHEEAIDAERPRTN